MAAVAWSGDTEGDANGVAGGDEAEVLAEDVELANPGPLQSALLGLPDKHVVNTPTNTTLN